MAGFDCTVSGICTLDASAGSAAFFFLLSVPSDFLFYLAQSLLLLQAAAATDAFVLLPLSEAESVSGHFAWDTFVCAVVRPAKWPQLP